MKLKDGREMILAAAPSFSRSERHYHIWREGALIHVDSDDLRLRFLADLQLDLDPIGTILELEGIAEIAKIPVKREGRAWRRSGYRLQGRILDGLEREDSELLFRSKCLLQLDPLHCPRHRRSTQSYQNAQAAMDALAAERHVRRCGTARDRIIDERHVHRARAELRDSEWREDQVKVS